MLDRYWQSVVDSVVNGANDYEELQIIYSLVKDQAERLSGDLDCDSIKKEFNTISTIELQLQDMLENYV